MSGGWVDAVRRVRRALPGDPAFGDPVSAWARVGDPTVTKELSLGAVQVFQALAEKAGRGKGDTEVTLLFTDLVGFSSWALKAGDELALELLAEVADALEPAVGAHRGLVVKRMGDGLMASFREPQQAFEAAHEGLRRLAGIRVGGYRPHLRAALHSGRPRALSGDYLGVDVNIAARLVERAGPDEVLASDVALAGLDPDRVVARRKKSFVLSSPKGVPAGMAVYAVTPADPTG